ncbi:hypothetical protein HPP92_008566 [Vanilla planifolia]|nr:hypothetical protein HPP92_008566 [Vanilla planifolia]
MDGDSLEPAFPENRPSVVLFIDRLSDLPSMREKSKSALEALMMLSEHYQMPYTVTMGAPGVYTRSSPQGALKSQAKTISDSLDLQYRRQSLGPEIVKIKDNLVNVINRGQSILSDQTASRTLGNAAYDALLDFLSNRNSVRRKQTKISFLAKEVGFQLLSDDFEIQVMDSTPNDQDKNS